MEHQNHDPASGFPTVRPRRLRHHPLIRDLVRETALTAACANSNVACASILLDHNADPNKSGARGTPLTLAAEWSAPDCMSLLLKHEARVDQLRAIA